ncbi:MCE family protein [Nocardioides sp. zg-579]|uniref:MCE family protein n=1 Tax=Nocardioides marmotae TaxID=2663857 RepID=A0A6I3J8G8_9ACTN|nr:MCE family protein [Nocardioides marmotae]MCR6031150.1 MCE family protein [Gordonia jinghuaiqii]MTB94789.1 MCE family protein [Nocardioides marmotae]QKE01218.1 MCE family protein [Nocardioides marmotae]
MSRNSTTIVAGVKLGIFTLTSVLVTGLLAVIMGNIGFGDKRTVTAEFTSASMLQEGDDVRIAGIPVGEVTSIELHERSRAMVRFTVAADVPLTTTSRAEIRYLNVVGDRYLALEEGPPGGKRLGDDARMPVSRTEPALDLTALYNGFQPLFSALEPAAVNELSQNIIDVLQGESGTVQGLLARTASLTTTLADRDELIGEVITNLDRLLGTVDRRRTQLSELVLGLEEWMGNLAEDREVIGTSVQNLSELTDTVADLLTRARPLLAEDVRELRVLVKTLAKKENLEVLTGLLERLPEAMTDQTRIGTYGSWYNYYLCDFEGSIKLPKILGIDLGWLEDALNDLSFHSTAPRCQ